MYPSPPGGYPPTPQHPAQLDAGPPPSGGTAITAAVLSILGVLAGLWQAILGFVIVAHGQPGVGLTLGIGGTFGCVLLGAGAVTVFVRKPLARWLITAGCVVVIVMIAVLMVLLGVLGQSSIEADPRVENVDGAYLAGYLTVFGFFTAIPAIATAVLALVPLTRRYLEWNRQPPGPPAPYGPPQPWQQAPPPPPQSWPQQQPSQQQYGPQQWPPPPQQ